MILFPHGTVDMHMQQPIWMGKDKGTVNISGAVIMADILGEMKSRGSEQKFHSFQDKALVQPGVFDAERHLAAGGFFTCIPEGVQPLFIVIWICVKQIMLAVRKRKINPGTHVKIDQGNIRRFAKFDGFQHGGKMGVCNPVVEITEEQILICVDCKVKMMLFCKRGKISLPEGIDCAVGQIHIQFHKI